MGSAATDISGVYSTADPTGRTWPADALTIRFVPVDHDDLDAYDRLYRTIKQLIFDRDWPGASVLSDESERIMPANRTPSNVSSLVYAGRKWPTCHITCSTRPKNIYTGVFANITHAALYALPKKEDRDTVAGNLGIPLAQLEHLWAALPSKKSFLWWTQETSEIRPVHSRLA
jgi:hypothetical protein